MNHCEFVVLLLMLLVCVPLRAPGQEARVEAGRVATVAVHGRARLMQVTASDMSDLPLVEVRAQGRSDLLAVFFSGDGGWTGIDQRVSARLAGAGVPVVGINSLRYFWSGRSPEKTAQDLARVLHHYLPEGRTNTRVLLIGYSTGADVLPFIVNRLPEDLRRRLASVNLIAPAHEAEFKIHLLEWVRQTEPRGAPLLPEIELLPPLPLLCMYGQGDDSALCSTLPPQYATVTLIGKGHHLGGKYEVIAERILSFVQSGVKPAA